MLNNYKNIGVVVLSAGRGSRLGCNEIPKVMLEIGGKPIVSYIVKTLQKIGFEKDQVCLVVGFQKEKIIDYFGDKVSYAVQEEQKGTAHASYVGIKSLPDSIDTVLVVNGDDSAFYRTKTIEWFLAEHVKNNYQLSLLSVTVDRPDSAGRVIRHENGDVEIIEKEYLTDKQRQINEISTNTFCFDRQWYEEMFPQMPVLRKLGEYGLPTAVAMARKQNKNYQIIEVENSSEWFGINNKEELKKAQEKKINNT